MRQNVGASSRRSGSLTGYGGGLAYKVKLLELEGIDCSKLKMPKQSRFL